jgi:hypothetical protein
MDMQRETALASWSPFQEKRSMKQFTKFALLALVLTFAVGAFAWEKSVTFSSDTTLNGQKIAAGDYRVQYTVNGSTADVKILKGKKEVATGTAQVSETAQKQDTQLLLQENSDGSKQLLGIRFGKTEIRFNGDASSGK